MVESKGSTELRIGLGFNGALRVLYPNGKSVELPLGDAEARIREILQDFRKDLTALRKEQSLAAANRAVDEALAQREIPPNPMGLPQPRRFGPLLRPNREITAEELGLED